MKANIKRIFIKYLPETINKDEIEVSFSNYGKVLDVAVKQRKEGFQHVESQFFAYVNIEIDDKSLAQCFKEFATNPWHGKYVQLELAKQSFLDILKEERGQTSNNVDKINVHQNSSEDVSLNDPGKNKSWEEPKAIKIKKINEKPKIKNFIDLDSNEVDQKSSKTTKKINTSKFNGKNEIPNLKKDVIEKNHSKPTENVAINTESSKSEIQRSKSVHQMIKNYQQQRLAIQSALRKVDSQNNKKIIFDDNEGNTENVKGRSGNKQENGQRNSLFESDDDDDTEETFNISQNFEVKDPKLFELQTKYKNDKRFKLDERFADGAEEFEENDQTQEMSLESEKKKELDILSQVLGSSLKPKDSNLQGKSVSKKGMLRFDPTYEDHLKYEVKQSEQFVTKKRKRKDNKNEETTENEKPIVSKEVFYKVDDSLKKALQGPEEFSLLNMYGQKGEEDTHENDEAEAVTIHQKNNMFSEKNPFQYDSSEDEMKNEPIAETEAEMESENTGGTFWSEPLFFREDDFRLQEGFDFVTRLGTEQNSEFGEQRRNLKQVMKTKVKNIQKNSNPFKKKLGGNKRKKNLRIKKAMKR